MECEKKKFNLLNVPWCLVIIFYPFYRSWSIRSKRRNVKTRKNKIKKITFHKLKQINYLMFSYLGNIYFHICFYKQSSYLKIFSWKASFFVDSSINKKLVNMISSLKSKTYVLFLYNFQSNQKLGRMISSIKTKAYVLFSLEFLSKPNIIFSYLLFGFRFHSPSIILITIVGL